VAAALVETTAAAAPVGAPVGDAAVALPSGGRQGAWFITQRVTNGGKPELPDCVKDDELIFDNKGGFISVIGGTPCNPSEVEVPAGTYKMAPDKPVISFTTPGLSYDGKIIKLTDKELVIEFDLGPGFLIQDTFSKR
jgi:Lipocalin-like domain